MKDQPSNGLVAKLQQLKISLDVFSRREAKQKFLDEIDELIASLERLRNVAMEPFLDERASGVRGPIEQVLDFLELARSNEAIAVLLSSAAVNGTTKPKRKLVQIPDDLTNDQIRALLKEDLTRAELKIIASQRAISFTKSNNDELKQSILRNLDRQEGYTRLATP